MLDRLKDAPTLIEAVGLESRDDMHGVMGVPAYDGLRTTTTKLIHFYTQHEFNLFDLNSDPHELKSLHDDPAWQDTLAEMKARYYRARERFDIPGEFGPGGRFDQM